jgi:hypothetical protein
MQEFFLHIFSCVPSVTDISANYLMLFLLLWEHPRRNKRVNIFTNLHPLPQTASKLVFSPDSCIIELSTTNMPFSSQVLVCGLASGEKERCGALA